MRTPGAAPAAGLPGGWPRPASVFLMTDASAPLWDLLRLAAFAQFPWRMLTFTALFLPLMAGALPSALGSRRDRAEPGLPREPSDHRASLVAPLLVVVVLASYPYLSPQMIEPPEGPVSLGGLMRFQQSANEMTGMTAWATAARPPGWSPLADVFASGKDVTEKVAREYLPAGAEAVDPAAQQHRRMRWPSGRRGLFAALLHRLLPGLARLRRRR